MRRQHLKFDFEECRQDLGARHTPINVLTRAENIYRSSVKAAGNGRVLAKRKSYTRQSMTFSGGSLSGEPEKILPGIGSSTYMRDTGGQNWIQNGTAWEYKSANPVRPWVDVKTTNPADFTQPRPNACLVGTKLWQFAVIADAYQVTVTDLTTGRISTEPFSVTATDLINLAPVWDGSHLWVLWTDGTANIRCHKFASGTVTSTPTATTYYTAGFNHYCQVIDAKYMSGSGKVFVVFGGVSTIASITHLSFISVSYLDPATGASSGAIPAVESWSRVLDSNSAGLTGLTIAAGQDAFTDTYQYFAITDLTSTAAHSIYLGRGQASVADLSGSFASVSLAMATSISSLTRYAGTVSAVATTDQLNGSAIVFASYFSESGYGSNRALARVDFRYGLSTIITQLSDLSCWVASGPVTYGGEWYLITGHDDLVNNPAITTTTTIQQGYFLRKFSDSKIVAMFSMGTGAARGHRNTLAIATADANIGDNAMNVPNLIAYSTKLYATVALTNSIGYVSQGLALIDMAHAYGKPVQAMGYGFVPGNIPTVWGINGAHEVAPLTAPPYILDMGSGSYTVAVRYVIRDGDGTLWRSAPLVKVGVPTGTITVPSLEPSIGSPNVFVEFYVSLTGAPKLQATVSNVSASLLVAHTFTSTLVDGESLDTFGGAIEQTWPVQCQAVGYWKNRVFLAQKNRLFYSQELSQGLGPLFNEDLSSIWFDIDGDINVIGAINWDYQALYADSRIGVISGSGPDGAGRGNFIIQTLPTRSGVTMANCGAVGQGPGGSYFQDSQTGRICLTTPSLQIVEVDIGVRDYESTASPVKWIEHLEAQRSMLMGAQFSGYYITAVIDYGHPTESCPYGQNYAWASGAGITMRSAVVDSSGLLMIDSDGATRRVSASSYAGDISSSGAAVPYGMWIRTGRLLPTGIQGEFSLVELKVLASIASGSSCKMGITGTYDDAVNAEKLFDVTSSAYQFGIKPYGAGRIQQCEVQIIERAPDSGVYNQAFYIEGLALEIISRNKLKTLSSGRVL